MQLHRRVVVLLLPQNADSFAQPADTGIAQLDRHARDHTSPWRQAAP